MSDPHRELVRDASRGDPAALEALLERHLPGLQAFVHLHAGERLRAKESTLDLVQSACREVLADLNAVPFPSEGAFKHWLYTAAERKIVDRARYYARDKRDAAREVAQCEDDSEERSRGVLQGCAGFYSPSQQAGAREELARVQAAFAQLPADYREVILSARIVGLSHAEIAERTGRAEGAVRMLLHRALARLARLIGPEGFAEDSPPSGR